MLKRLWQLGQPQRWRTYLQVLGQWLSELLVLTILVTLTLRYTNHQWSQFWVTLLVVQVVLVLLYQGLLASRLSDRWAHAASTELQTQFFDYYLAQTGPSQQQTMTVIHQDLGTIKRLSVLYDTIIPTTLQLILTGMMMVVAIIWYHPITVLIPLFGILAVGAGMGMLQGMGNKKNLAYIDSFNQMGERFLADFNGMKTLIMYNRQQRYAKDFATDSENFRQKTMGVLSYQLQTLTIMDFFLYGALGWFVMAQGQAIQQGTLTLPHAVLISTLVCLWLIDFRKFGYFIHIFISLLPKVSHLFQLLDQPLTVTTTATSQALTPHKIQLSGTVGYEAPLLTDVDFTLTRGHLVGLAGTSGSGKSTLAKTLLQQLPLLSGTLTVDDQPLAAIAQLDWWQTIAYLGPDTVLFDDTIEHNLLLGVSHPGNWQARLADLGLCQFVLALPNQFQTQVGENGAQLSQGQRQQVAVARAILADKAVYLFDEITANIDVENADVILAAIKKLAQTKLMLLITHRLADIEQLPACYLIDQGHLTYGTPQQLAQQVPAFQALLDEQAALLKEVQG